MAISVPTTDWADWVLPTVQELDGQFPGFSWGTYPGHDPNEAHAADAMVPKWQTAAGRTKGQVLADHVASRDFMVPRGMWYVIFYGRIWSMTRPDKGWLPYFDRNSTNPSRSHKNHVHNSWYAKKPSNVTLPEPAPYTDGWVPDLPWVFYLDKQEIGVTQSDTVWLIQKALGRKPYDGTYTAELRAAVADWQLNTLHDDPRFCDGILGVLQARSLFTPDVQIEVSST